MRYTALCKQCLGVGVKLLADGELVWLVILCHTKLRARKEEAVRNSGEGWTRGSRRFIKKMFGLCCECSLLPQRQPHGFRKANVSSKFLFRYWSDRAEGKDNDCEVNGASFTSLSQPYDPQTRGRVSVGLVPKHPKYPHSWDNWFMSFSVLLYKKTDNAWSCSY